MVTSYNGVMNTRIFPWRMCVSIIPESFNWFGGGNKIPIYKVPKHLKVVWAYCDADDVADVRSMLKSGTFRNLKQSESGICLVKRGLCRSDLQSEEIHAFVILWSWATIMCDWITLSSDVIFIKRRFTGVYSIWCNFLQTFGDKCIFSLQCTCIIEMLLFLYANFQKVLIVRFFIIYIWILPPMYKKGAG